MHTVCFNNVTGINGILYCDDGEACCGVANDQWCCQGHDHGNNTWYIAILIAVSTLVSLVLLIVSVFILRYLKTRDIHRTQRIIGLSRRLAYVDTPSQASQTDSNGGLSPMAATYPHIGGGKFELRLPPNLARVKGKEFSPWSVRPNTVQMSPVPKVIYRPDHYQTVDGKSCPLDHHVANNGKRFSVQNSQQTEKEKILLPKSTVISNLPDNEIFSSNSNKIIRGEILKRDHHETNARKILSPDDQKAEDGEIPSPNACEKMYEKITPEYEIQNRPHPRKIIDCEILSPVVLEKLQEISSPCHHTTDDCDIVSPEVHNTFPKRMSSSAANGPVFSEILPPYTTAINEREISSCDAHQTIIGEIPTSKSHETDDKIISTPLTSEPITDETLSLVAQETIADEILSPTVQETVADEILSPVAQETVADEILSPVSQETVVDEILSPVVQDTIADEILSPVVQGSIADEILTPVAQETVADEILSPVAQDTIADEILSPVVQGTIANEILSPVAQETVADEILSPVAQKTIADEILSPVLQETVADEILSPVVQGTIADEILSPVAQETVADEIMSPVAQETIADEIMSLVVQGTIADEILSLVAQETVADEILSLVDQETVADEILSPVVQGTIADEILSPVAQETVADEILSPVAQETIANEILSPVDQETVADEILSPVAQAALDVETFLPAVVCENIDGGKAPTVIHETYGEEISSNEPSGTNRLDLSPLGTNITTGGKAQSQDHLITDTAISAQNTL